MVCCTPPPYSEGSRWRLGRGQKIAPMLANREADSLPRSSHRAQKTALPSSPGGEPNGLHAHAPTRICFCPCFEVSQDVQGSPQVEGSLGTPVQLCTTGPIASNRQSIGNVHPPARDRSDCESNKPRFSRQPSDLDISMASSGIKINRSAVGGTTCRV